MSNYEVVLSNVYYESTANEDGRHLAWITEVDPHFKLETESKAFNSFKDALSYYLAQKIDTSPRYNSKFLYSRHHGELLSRILENGAAYVLNDWTHWVRQPAIKDALEAIDIIEDGDFGAYYFELRYVKAFAFLIKTGVVWEFQGSYQRAANNYIKYGIISKHGRVNWRKWEQFNGNN